MKDGGCGASGRVPAGRRGREDSEVADRDTAHGGRRGAEGRDEGCVVREEPR